MAGRPGGHNPFKHERWDDPYVSPYMLEILSSRSGAPSWPCATGALTANTGQVVTTSRNAGAFCTNRSGVEVFLRPNTVRVNPSGLIYEVPRINYMYKATQPDGVGAATDGWTLYGSRAPTASHHTTDLVAPDGSNDACKYVWPVPGLTTDIGWVYQLTGAGGTAVGSCWITTGPGGGTKTLYANRTTGGVNGSIPLTITEQWQRFYWPSGGYFVLGYGNDSGDPQPGSGTFYVWGGQVEAAVPFAAETYPTSLIPSEANFVPGGEDLTLWTQAGQSAAIIAGTAPNGSAISRLSCSAGNIQHITYQAMTFGNIEQYCQTVYAKAGTVNFLGIALGNTSNKQTVVDLSNGTLSLTNGVTATITSQGSGWYRIDLSATIAVGDQYFILCAGDTAAHASASISGVSWTAAGTENVLVGGTQVMFTLKQSGTTYYPTYTHMGSAAGRDEDITVVHNPLSDLAQPVTTYRASATVMPITGTDWNVFDGNYHAFLSSPNSTQVDSWALYFRISGWLVGIDTWDHSTLEKFTQGTGSAFSGPQTFLATQVFGGALTTYQNGVFVSNTSAGGGNGTPNPQYALIGLGKQAGGGINSSAVILRDIYVNNT